MPAHISRATYADMHGPTTGDRVRLGDTDLIIEVERDLTTLHKIRTVKVQMTTRTDHSL